MVRRRGSQVSVLGLPNKTLPSSSTVNQKYYTTGFVRTLVAVVLWRFGLTRYTGSETEVTSAVTPKLEDPAISQRLKCA